MTTPNRILVDLLAGQATSDALSETLRIPMLTVRAMCERHAKDGLLQSTTIAGALVVWSLTAPGREAAVAVKKPRGGAKSKAPSVHS